MARAPAELTIDPPYDAQLNGILAFSNFAAAEKTILQIEKLRQGYRVAGDKKGVEYCRRLALQGRRRAELIGRNKRVGLRKRLQKIEIAAWFQVWLETPDLFEEWLQLRKASAGFRNLQDSDSVGPEPGTMS
ncbi:MAG TPA: hypothetical protein VE398_03510 [Acidobacteriota bacterium]|nr:hypothetical protein [Acidobacteriota bacterium]